MSRRVAFELLLLVILPFIFVFSSAYALAQTNTAEFSIWSPDQVEAMISRYTKIILAISSSATISIVLIANAYYRLKAAFFTAISNGNLALSKLPTEVKITTISEMKARSEDRGTEAILGPAVDKVKADMEKEKTGT